MDSPNNLDDYNLRETIKRTIITQPTIQDANIWEKPDKKPNVDAKEEKKGSGCLSFFIIIMIYSLIPSMISLVTSNHAIALCLIVFLVFIVLTGVREIYSNSIADIYVVTASSNYETIQTNRIKHDYKRIPSGSRLAHLYDPRPEADPEGNWYIYIPESYSTLGGVELCDFEHTKKCVKIKDFKKAGDKWHVEYQKRISYKIFKHSKWWE